VVFIVVSVVVSLKWIKSSERIPAERKLIKEFPSNRWNYATQSDAILIK